VTTPPASRTPLNLPRGCSSEADHVLNVLSSLVRALKVAGPDVEREARLTADAPLMEFLRVTRQGAMQSLDYWFTPRRPDEWRGGAACRAARACQDLVPGRPYGQVVATLG
jgi:hypothetical protein